MVNFLGGLTMRMRLAVVGLGIAALLLPAAAARSAVIWTFFETSCSANSGANCTFQPASGLAQLILPDINSSGSWSFFFDSATQTSTESGDTDFSFDLPPTGMRFHAPHFVPGLLERGSDISYDISFASSPTALTISADFMAANDQFCIRHPRIGPVGCGGGSEFSVASDNVLLGCVDTQCQITGNWVLALVAEPSPIRVIAGPLIGVAMLALGRRRAARRRVSGHSLKIAAVSPVPPG